MRTHCGGENPQTDPWAPSVTCLHQMWAHTDLSPPPPPRIVSGSLSTARGGPKTPPKALQPRPLNATR